MGNSDEHAQFIDSLELLLFCIDGIKLGIDATQIEALLKIEDAEAEGIKLIRFDEIAAFAGRKLSYKEPRQLLLKTGEAIITEQPYDIINIDIDAIRPLPSLFCSSQSAGGAVWGAAILDAEIIMLVDFSGVGSSCALAHTSQIVN